MDERYTYERIERAFKEQNGGRFRLICNRKIDGRQCVCYAREATVAERLYWEVHYKVDGIEITTYTRLVDKMYGIAHSKSVALYEKGKTVVMWRY